VTKGVKKGGRVVKHDALQTSRKFRKIAKTKAMQKILIFRGEHAQVYK